MNNHLQKYLILLQPLAPFFFGSEQGQTADYYLKGNNFPQQTALLGLLRHQLLMQNGLLPDGKIINTSKAGELIGTESFQYDKPQQNFGVIEAMSECSIFYSTNTVAEKDSVVYQYQIAMPEYAKSLTVVKDHYVFSGYNPKKHYTQHFNLLNQSDICRPSFAEYDIFKPTERPGIDKNYDGKPNEDAYYKQVWLSMPKSFSFGFYVTIRKTFSENIEVILKDSLVNFGKESSPFNMTARKVETSQESEMAPNQGQNTLLLTSDAYLTKDISANCEVAVTDTVPFRNVINQVSQSSNAYFNRKPAQITGSKRLQLYKKGSFFYSKNIETVADIISGQNQFVKIGYNRFQFTTITILI